MIRAFYGLTQNPFDARERELLPQQQEIHDTLKVHCQQGGLCLVLGVPGSGKSVIKQSLQRLPENQYVVATVARTLHTYTNTVKILCDAFRIEFQHSAFQCERRLIEQAFSLNHAGKCLTTILDDTLPLTVLEWEEWGNPVTDPDIYAVMKSYSPYDNVRRVADDGRPLRYPDLFVTAGLSDPRVGFWEPAKWVAKLRAANPENRVLLKCELGAGHSGPSGRYDAWKEEALVFAFLLDALGMHAPDGRPGQGLNSQS